MDYRIFNVCTWSFLCVRIHTGVWHTDSKSAQHFWLRKILTKFSCDPDGVRTSGHWILSLMLYQLSHPVHHPVTCWTQHIQQWNYDAVWCHNDLYLYIQFHSLQALNSFSSDKTMKPVKLSSAPYPTTDNKNKMLVCLASSSPTFVAHLVLQTQTDHSSFFQKKITRILLKM